jgi:hypothetical protein
MNGPTAIAVADWTSTRVINADAGACAPFDTEWVYDDGSPALHVDTWVDHGSIQLYQGRTVTNTLGTAGIITLLGARAGDTVRLQKGCGPGCSISGSWTVSCGGAAAAAAAAAPLILTPDPFALEVSARPQDGGSTIEITVRASATLAAAPEVTVWQAGVAEGTAVAMAWDNDLYAGTAVLDPALDLRGQVLARATDPQGHEVTVLAAFVVERASDEELTWVKSEDGRMDLFLPPGSLPGEPAVSILPAAQMGGAQGALAIVGGPYEVSVSSGVTTLAEPATVNIYYDLALATGVNEASLRIHHWDADAGQWVSDGGAVDLTRHFASTQVGDLGIFAVAGERALPAYLPMVLRGGP